MFSFFWLDDLYRLWKCPTGNAYPSLNRPSLRVQARSAHKQRKRSVRFNTAVTGE